MEKKLETVKQLIEKKKITTDPAKVVELLKGKTVEFINGSYASYGFTIGAKYKIPDNITYMRNSGNDYITGFIAPIGGSAISVVLANIKLIANSSTVKDFEDQLAEIEKEEKELSAKRKNIKETITFMQENEVGSFDETVFSIFQALKKVKSGKNDIETAQEIAKIFE